MIVIHYTAMTGGVEPAIKRLSMPETEVSCHYIIGEDGAVFQLVDDDRRAWHAGIGRWGACDDVNSRSLGIELSNDGASPFAARQMDALDDLLRQLMARHSIPATLIVGHSDIAPGRKIDPGPRFDWRRLARRGLAVWPGPSDSMPDAAAFRDAARRAGYTSDVDDATLLDAIRARFRPAAEGPLDARDMGLVLTLAESFPVDQGAVAV